MGQGLIHQCEKGKPPAGVFVCYKDIFEEPHRLKTKIKINEFLIRFLQGDFFFKAPPLQETGSMGQVLVHQCEKGKPPAGVSACYKDIFEEPNRLKTKIKIYEFLIRFAQGDFFSKHLLCKRGG